MIELMPSAPAGVIAVRASGWLLREDFDVVRPLVEEALREGRGLRALIYIDDSFAGITPGALLADLVLGLRAFGHWSGCAVVTPGWLLTSARLVGHVAPWPVRTFDVSEMDAAMSWLAGLSERGPRRLRLVRGAGTGERS
jgi:hypothetical protein